MKIGFQYLFVSLLAVQPAFSQQKPVVPVPGIVPYMTVNPGDFNIRQNDVTQLLNSVLEKGAIRQQVDREYLIETTKILQADYESLVELIANGDLLKLSQRSSNGESIDVAEYFIAINAINTQLAVVNSKISALTSITSRSLPSQVVVNDGVNTQTLPSFGQIDFSEIKNLFTKNVQNLTTTANNLVVKIQYKSGVIEVVERGTALNPALKNAQVYTAAEMEDLREKIQEKRTIAPDSSSDRAADDHAKEVKRLLAVFVDNFGTSERWRSRDDKSRVEQQGRGGKIQVEGVEYADYYTARDKTFQKIVEIFWSRSYLRAKYGLQIGALQPSKYNKQVANLDTWLVATEALSSFRSERAIQESELDEAAENIRNVMKVADARSSHVFGEESHGNWLVKANSLMTFIGGKRPQAEAIFMVMQLVYADIQEEKMLTEAGGFAKLREFYFQRYQTSQQNRKFYSTLKCNMDSDARDGEDCLSQDDSFRDVISNTSSIRAQFNAMNGFLSSMVQSLEEADLMEQQLQIALASNKAFQKVKNRIKGL